MTDSSLVTDSSPGSSSESTCVDKAIRSRRTNLRIDREQLIEEPVFRELIELATWAPNHHLTEPWRFAILQGEARSRLGMATAEFQQSRGVTDELKLEKTKGKFLRAPAIIAVACESKTYSSTKSSSESSVDGAAETQREDRDAVAAAIQNLLLAATVRGLCTYWGSGAVCDSPEVKRLCGFDEGASILAMIYIGYPMASSLGNPPSNGPQPSRTSASIAWVN